MTSDPRDMHLCQSCGLRHEHVECIGIFHCPNPLCKGSGAAIHRSKLKSYVDKGDTHSIDWHEWLRYGLNNLPPDDDAIREAALRSAQWIVNQMASTGVGASPFAEPRTAAGGQ